MIKLEESRLVSVDIDKEELLRVGVITSPHAVTGEVNVFPTTDDIQRFKLLKTVYIDTKKKLYSATVSGVKFFKGTVILRFEEFDDRDIAEQLRSCDILIDRKDALPLGEDEYYICDLIGFDIITDEGTKLGTLKDVLQTGANDVYIVNSLEKPGKEYLIPAIRDCILETNTEEHRITVHLLKGMID